VVVYHALLVPKPPLMKRIVFRAGSAAVVNAATGSAGVMAGVGIAGGLSALWKTVSTKEEELYSPKPGTLAGQTIVVTGASTGLGLESTKRWKWVVPIYSPE
jgi:hypothetical protein